MPTDILGDLKEYLAGISSGRITDVDTVVDLLASIWPDLPGSDEHAMASRKLARAEALKWEPPHLSFIIERHGGTVMGSTRAELQKWTLNVSTGAVDCDELNSYRQLAARDAPLRVGPLAEEIAKAICKSRDDPRLKWFPDRRSVRVLVGDFITGQFKQTEEGRRKRFRLALEERLKPAGWQRVPYRRGLYQRT